MSGTDEKSITSPAFIFNIDTELLWGFNRYPEHRVARLLQQDAKCGRGAIDLLLRLCEKYHIPATWAIVGQLFLDKSDAHPSPLYHGKDILDKILASPIKHEIGYHSFSHVDFSQCRPEVAEKEIERGVELAKGLDITLKTFVFPENKVGYVDILQKYGFEIYRGRNRRPEGQNLFINKSRWALDRIAAPPVTPRYLNGIWELPGSMYFSPPQPPLGTLSRARLGLYRAINSNKLLCIFLHPWNLLLDRSLKLNLGKLFALVAQKREEGKLQVMTMGELAAQLNRSKTGIGQKEVGKSLHAG